MDLGPLGLLGPGQAVKKTPPVRVHAVRILQIAIVEIFQIGGIGPGKVRAMPEVMEQLIRRQVVHCFPMVPVVSLHLEGTVSLQGKIGARASYDTWGGVPRHSCAVGKRRRGAGFSGRGGAG